MTSDEPARQSEEPFHHQPDPPPIETPGPSVSPPKWPESDTERRERIDAMMPDEETTGEQDPLDHLIAQEEWAAAAEAGALGGDRPRDADDPAMEPVYEAGEGDQEGWELAERDLIENATHGEGRGNPIRDAPTPELETDRSTAVYGENNRLPSTQVRHDPDEGPDDPMEGDPHQSADRGPNSPEDG
jgi:hypothetical protein